MDGEQKLEGRNITFDLLKGLFLFDKAWNMINDCVSVTKILMMGVKLMAERYKKVKFSAKIRKVSQKKSMYFPAQQWLLPINFNLLSLCFSIMLTIRSVILKSTLH